MGSEPPCEEKSSRRDYPIKAFIHKQSVPGTNKFVAIELDHNNNYTYIAAAATAAARALPIPRLSSPPAPAPASVGCEVGTFNFSIPAVTVNGL